MPKHAGSPTAELSDLPAGTRRNRWRAHVSRWFVFAGVFLIIFGAKLGLIDFAGSDLPTWDQWDSEGEITLRPWLEGRLTAENITRAHTEHRIVTTKLQVLALLAANGEWDGFVETTANALIHAALAVTLLALVRRWLRGGWRVAFGALLIALFALPFASDNTLVGFQVQFYYLLWFALLHLWLTLRSDRFSGAWVAGQIAGTLGLVSMGSGFFSAAAVLAVLALRFVRGRRLTAQQLTSAGIAVALVVAGYFLKAEVPGHAILKAHSVGQFLWCVLQMLTWPVAGLLPWSLVLVLPAAAFVRRCWRTRSLDPDDDLLLALLVWLVLQMAAAAYARGDAGVLTSRYLDFLTISLVAGFICVAREFPARIAPYLAGIWLCAMGVGLGLETKTQWDKQIVPGEARRRHGEENVKAYLFSGDASHLMNKPFGEIPYPNGEILRSRLEPEAIRRVMPPSVRTGEPILANEHRHSALPSGLGVPESMRVLSTWSAGSEGRTFTWRSPMQSPAALPILRFRILGDLGPAHPSLRLVVKSEAGEVAVKPDAAPGGRWKSVNVFRPSGAWWIEATDSDPDGWFAFTEPVQVGRLGWLAGKLLKFHLAAIVLGAVALIAGGALARRNRAGGPK